MCVRMYVLTCVHACVHHARVSSLCSCARSLRVRKQTYAIVHPWVRTLSQRARVRCVRLLFTRRQLACVVSAHARSLVS